MLTAAIGFPVFSVLLTSQQLVSMHFVSGLFRPGLCEDYTCKRRLLRFAQPRQKGPVSGAKCDPGMRKEYDLKRQLEVHPNLTSGS